jgi:hypothetical protein
MGIAGLIELAPPPESPLWAGRPEDWPALEAKLGTGLPDDYKQYVAAYGAGGFHGFLEIITPFSPKYDLLTKQQRTRTYLEAQDVFPVFPNPGGLLYVGGDDNGNSLCWLTKGGPNCWPIVYCTEDFIEMNVFGMTLSDFLSGWIAQQIHPTFLYGLDIHSRPKPIFKPNALEMYK